MVIVSNGYHKYHLSLAASEASKRGLLSLYVTGAYPTPSVKRFCSITRLSHNKRVQRLYSRVDDIPEDLVRAEFSSELFAQASAQVAPLIGPQARDSLTAYALRRYARRAVKWVEWGADRGARIYHYRSGFGHESVERAKQLGLVALCDHSAAHPALYKALIAGGGNAGLTAGVPPGRMWSDILLDVSQADAVLVNSDYLKSMFLEQGWTSSRVHVIYLGVDDAFIKSVPPRKPSPPEAPLRLMYAGGFIPGKGASVLVQALQRITGVNWRLDIAGGVAPEIARAHAAFLGDSRVRTFGHIPRDQLAVRMTDAYGGPHCQDHFLPAIS